MRLETRGHPIHTRALSVALAQRDDGALAASAYVLDLRKRGVVPVAADLQGPGVIHHMAIEAVIDPARRTLLEIGARQPNVAFEPSAITRGESCRDPVARIEALRGTVLDDGYARRLSAAIGGPLGCSHILTAAQLLGASVRWALEHAALTGRRAGERVFRRDVVVDGVETAERTLAMAVQLTDLHFAPAAAVARPMARLGSVHEMRALAQVDLDKLALTELEIAERRRSATDIDTAPWNDRRDAAESLIGQPALRGISVELLRQLADAPQDAPIYDALLMLAPTLIQCFATMSDGWLRNTRDSESLIGMGGLPDSCYMWRRGGALDESRTPSDPLPAIAK